MRCVESTIWSFKKHLQVLPIVLRLKKNTCFIPLREIRSISSRGPIIFTRFWFCVKNRIWQFQNQATTVTFFPLENVLSPPRQMCKISSSGPIVFAYVLILDWQTYMTLSKSNCNGDRFFSLQNVFIPEGRCRAYPVGVRLFLLIYYWI